MANDPLHPVDAAERQRALILGVVRMAFLILVVTIGLLTVLEQRNDAELPLPWWFPITAGVALFVIALSIDLLTPDKKISTIGGVFLGLLAGLLATVAFSLVMDLVVRTYVPVGALDDLAPGTSLIKLLVGVSLCYLGISTVLQTQDDFRLVIPYVEFSKQRRGPRPLLLDSSALVDARVVDLAELGLFPAPLVIPAFVVGELQTLSDSADKLKRGKGRRGLDMVHRLQRAPGLEVVVDPTPIPGRAVDAKLVELAGRMAAGIVTTDAGLEKVARIQGVPVVNVNEVATAARPALVPGQVLALRVVRAGEQPGQGVGYMDDGAMVVVEGGADHVDEMVQAEIVSTIQTSAGRMIFAQLFGGASSGVAPAVEAPPEQEPEENARGESASESAGASEDASASNGQGESKAERPERSPYPPVKPRGKKSARSPRR